MSGKRRKTGWGLRILIALLATVGVIGFIWLAETVPSISGFLQADLGQLIIAILLIPAAILAVWETLDTLREASDRPALELAFLDPLGQLQDTYSVQLPVGGGQFPGVTFALQNNGGAIAVWWQVTLFTLYHSDEHY